ncbi:MAG: hypothetical protein WD069_10425 [Planctomycetales bacterium]
MSRSKRYGIAMCLCVAAVGIVLLPTPAGACSQVAASRDKEAVLATYWGHQIGFFTVNPRGLRKKQLFVPGKAEPVEWVSKHGSVTYNLFAVGFPMEGMNEAGLAVATLSKWTLQPSDSGRKGRLPRSWVQYALDRFGTVEEVVRFTTGPEFDKMAEPEELLKYLPCDAEGNVAVLEMVDGEMAAYSDRTPKAIGGYYAWPKVAEILKEYQGFGGEKPLPPQEQLQTQSPEQLKQQLKFTGPPKVSMIKGPLQFAHYDPARWQGMAAYALGGNIRTSGSLGVGIAYDVKNRQIHWGPEGIRFIKLSSLDFAPSSGMKILPRFFRIADKGEVSARFADLDLETYPKLMDDNLASYRHLDVVTRLIPPEDWKKLAAYPASFERAKADVPRR